jgi:hypothetical protein
MILSAHQLNFMPWIGFFYKMIQADKFLLADDVQYTTHGYTNRVEIKTIHGKKWLTVPVLTKGKGLQIIKDVQIENSQNWKHKHWDTLKLNYRYAPYFEHYAEFFNGIYEKQWKYLIDLNIHIINFLRAKLKINTPIYNSSELLLSEGTTERIVGMAKKLNCTLYLSGASGKKYMREKDFMEAGITLKYASFVHPEYHQQFGKFVPNLSIIDLLFNEGPNSGRILKDIKKKLKHQ